MCRKEAQKLGTQKTFSLFWMFALASTFLSPHHLPGHRLLWETMWQMCGLGFSLGPRALKMWPTTVGIEEPSAPLGLQQILISLAMEGDCPPNQQVTKTPLTIGHSDYCHDCPKGVAWSIKPHSKLLPTRPLELRQEWQVRSTVYREVQVAFTPSQSRLF